MKATHEIAQDLFKVLNDQMDDACIEGLKRKGFTFENRNDVVQFVLDRCRCEVREGEKTYFVDDTPFLLFIPDTSFDTKHSVEERENQTFSATLGRFAYL